MKLKAMMEDRHDFPDCLFLIFDTMKHAGAMPTRGDVRHHLADCEECGQLYDEERYGPR